MSKTFYVNLFHNGFFKFTGFKKSLENGESGGKHPVMLPMSTKLLKSVSRTAKRFPYELDETKNIRKFSSNKFEIAFLVPTRDVNNLSESDYEKSLWFRLTDSSEKRVEELKQKLDDKKDTIGKLRKEKRNLKSEEEERNKGQSSSTSTDSLKCPECGVSSPRSTWNDNRGACPNCGRAFVGDPGVQNV